MSDGINKATTYLLTYLSLRIINDVKRTKNIKQSKIEKEEKDVQYYFLWT